MERRLSTVEVDSSVCKSEEQGVDSEEDWFLVEDGGGIVGSFRGPTEVRS